MASHYGIIEFHVPEGPTQVLIVFVHGLRGKAESTWTYPGSTPWPKDLLPASLTKSKIATNKIQAEILAFSYDADIVNLGEAAGQNSIAQHARNLLGRLKNKRLLDALEDVPIIFVAHSLGGLVVKNALAIANRSPETPIRKIIDSTTGIIFLGTPHCGADAAKFAKFLSGLTSIFRPTDSKLLDVLKRDSEVLAIITADFHEMLRLRGAEKPELMITCFTEEKPMQRGPISHMIVDAQSATIPGYQHYSIHADHEMMTKFRNESASGYEDVVSEIIEMAKARGKGQPTKVEPAKDAVKDHWTKGTNSGAVNVKQGDNHISHVTASSRGGSQTFGNNVGL